MQNFLIGRVLKWTAGRLDGHKTTIGGVGMILTGLLGLVGYMFPDQGLPPQDLDTALMTISGGFAIIGLGGKIEKAAKTPTAQHQENVEG